MRYEKIMKRYNAAIADLRQVYKQAATAHYTHAQIIDYVAAIRHRLNECPIWAKERFSGYDLALWDMHQTLLVFGGFCNDKFYTTESSHPLYYTKLGIKAIDVSNSPAETKQFYYRDTVMTNPVKA